MNYVVLGLWGGLNEGFNTQVVSLKSAIQNMPSVSLMPSVIDQYLLTKL